MFDKTIVSFQGVRLTDPAEVASVILSIAGEPEIRLGLMQMLLDEALAAFDGTSYGTSDTVSQIISTALHRHLASPDTQIRAESAALLQRFYAYLGETVGAATAYNPKMKPNPNAVFWPDPTAAPPHARSIYDELPYVRPLGIVGHDTPIGSAGSCFATEIARYLKGNRYNYVVTEDNEMSSANWGIIFNTPSFRQLVERAFGLRRLPRLLWARPGPNGAVYLDPFREGPVFASVEAYEEDLERHVVAAREALLKAKIFVITLGMNEVWRLKADGSALSRAPWNLAPYLVERHVLTPEQNVAELERMLAVWRSFNPDLQLIVTVSPVPLHATFRGDDFHVIAANAHSKSVLRVAAEAFCERNPGVVHYFPSYETVMYCTRDAWDEDQRHVSPAAVSRVMALFEAMFVKGAPVP